MASKSKVYFTWFSKLLIILSATTFIADFGGDIYLAVMYAMEGHVFYSALTIICVFVPSVISSIYSFLCYLNEKHDPLNKPSTCTWIIRGITLVLQINPLLRYFDTWRYGTLSNNAKHQARYEYKQLMEQESLDASKLRLYEAYMEAGSQTMLQLYIIARNFETTEFSQYAKVGISFISMAVSMTSYLRNIRKVNDTVQKIRKRILPIIFLWVLLLLVCRLEAISLFASATRCWVLVFLAFHWSLMFNWMLWMKTEFFRGDWCKERFYNAAIAYIQIFIYYNVKNTPTRYRILSYYLVYFMENTILILVWFKLTDFKNTIYYAAFAVHYSTFSLGLFIMIAYYLWLHPSGEIPFCRDPPQCFKGIVENFSGSGQIEDSREENTIDSLIIYNGDLVPHKLVSPHLENMTAANIVERTAEQEIEKTKSDVNQISGINDNRRGGLLETEI